ncbi:hypothetical protein SAMN06265360_1025 [Haloechinothrix alba]|uniref:Uncharacterized protein n=1 Tax=Haloechinothrix alba TaxID=664784 RepID=A0A238VC33_9PSEU|nr:hypothetical protein SAMN06265360_1025 [Haloechinothrix alba]
MPSKGERYIGESALRTDAYRSCRTSMSGSTRSCGTNTSSATVLTLPDPQRPAAYQSSTIVRSDIGTSAMTGCCPPSDVGGHGDDLLPVTVPGAADESPLPVHDDPAIGVGGRSAGAHRSAHADVRCREHLVLNLVREQPDHPRRDPPHGCRPRGRTVTPAEFRPDIDQRTSTALVPAIPRGNAHPEQSRFRHGLDRLVRETPVLLCPHCIIPQQRDEIGGALDQFFV